LAETEVKPPLVQAKPFNGYKVHAIHDYPGARIEHGSAVFRSPRSRAAALCGVRGRDSWCHGWMTLVIRDDKPVPFLPVLQPDVCPRCERKAHRLQKEGKI